MMTGYLVKWKMSLSNLPEAIVSRIQKARGLATESSLSLQKQRLEICDKCPEKKMIGTEVCGLCGCFLQLKTLVEDEHCQIKKW